MKSILYVGATLMIGASIYGFVDYKSTQHKKEFTSMYDEEKKSPPVIVEEKTDVAVIAEKEQVVAKKTVAKKKLTGKKELTEDDITVIKPIADDELIDIKESKEFDKTIAPITPSKEDVVVKKVKKKKRLDSRIFSRAPLRDMEDLPKPIKKTEVKEQ